MKGVFVTFEGIEGCGKSTQVQLLVDYLTYRNIPHITTREPGGTPIAEAIRNLLLDPECKEMLPETELLLYCASRAQHTGELILPALSAGKVVICDRYYDSTYAYQGAARALSEPLIDTLTGFSTFQTIPDLTVLLDMNVEDGLSRIQERKLDRMEQENIEFHRKVREQFLSIAKKHAHRYLVLNGSDPREFIHSQIQEAINTLIGD